MTKDYNGMNLAVLCPTNKETGEVISLEAFQMHKWVEEGVFKALEEGYLER